MNKKIPAFTILEVTVAMLLAAIAVGISYTAFTIISSSYRTYDRQNRNASGLLLADKLLKKDFMEANSIIRTEDGLHIDRPGGAIEYRITDSLVIRNQFGLRTDTFRVAVQNVRCMFENEECLPGSKADRLSFEARAEKETFNLVYAKLYSSESLMNPYPANH